MSKIFTPSARLFFTKEEKEWNEEEQNKALKTVFNWLKWKQMFKMDPFKNHFLIIPTNFNQFVQIFKFKSDTLFNGKQQIRLMLAWMGFLFNTYQIEKLWHSCKNKLGSNYTTHKSELDMLLTSTYCKTNSQAIWFQVFRNLFTHVFLESIHGRLNCLWKKTPLVVPNILTEVLWNSI